MDKIQEMLPTTFPTVVKTIESDDEACFSFKLEVECAAEDFETWLKEFEKITKTNYTVRKKTAKGRLYVRTLYATCHHNTYGKFYDAENYKYGSKNTQCPAKITMKKKIPPLNGMHTSTLIFVEYNHNHPILAADSLRFRRPTNEIEEKFLKLFQNGHSPGSALHLHNLDLILENPENYELMLADNSISPNIQWISRLHKKVAESSYGSNKLNNEDQAQLIARLASEKNCLYKIVQIGTQIAIILITRMMLRISTMEESGETCFVDSSGGVDRDGTRFFIFLTKCHAGGVPLGVVLTTSENQSLLTEAFKAFRDLLPPDAFGKRSNLKGPRVFITDDSASERNSLRETWPDTKLLLCIFHVLQALWRWLFDKKHNILLMDRKHLLNLFKSLMYAKSKEELEELFHRLTIDSCVKKYPNYQKHITSYIDRQVEWALCYRDELMVRGNNTNNVSESAMKIMKDHVLQRVRAYNIVQLADFVISRLDLYFEQKILNVAFNRLSSTLLRQQACLGKNVEFARGKIVKEDDYIYYVPSESNPTERYMVNMELAYCECIKGKDGQLCKHQLAVLKFMEVSNINILPVFDSTQKQYLYYIATGKNMNVDFFCTLKTQSNTRLSQSEMHNLSQPSTSRLSLQSELEPSTSKSILEPQGSNESDKEIREEHIDATNLELAIQVATENLKETFDDLLCNLKEKPDIYLPAVQTFTKKYQGLKKTDSNLVSSLFCFGKFLNESTVSATINTVKRKGKKIGVQPTSISRRQIVHSGKGRNSLQNTGRPRKRPLVEHNYAAKRKPSKSPHHLSTCVDYNMSGSH